MTAPQTHGPLPVVDHHGPGTPGPLRPGRRGSVLVITPPADPEAAMSDALGWISAFEQDCGLVLDPEATSLYAVRTLRPGTGPDEPAQDDGVAAFLDFVLAAGRWHHRTDGLSSADAHDAVRSGPSAWGRLVHQLEREAAPGSLATVWDVHPLPAAA